MENGSEETVRIIIINILLFLADASLAYTVRYSPPDISRHYCNCIYCLLRGCSLVPDYPEKVPTG